MVKKYHVFRVFVNVPVCYQTRTTDEERYLYTMMVLCMHAYSYSLQWYNYIDITYSLRNMQLIMSQRETHCYFLPYKAVKWEIGKSADALTKFHSYCKF